MSPAKFSEIHCEELLRHLSRLKKKGASAPIILTGEEHIFVNKKNLHRVIDYAAAGSISKELLSYLLDALSLDGNTKFANDELREVVLDLADSESRT